jgi:hypothetical protein
MNAREAAWDQVSGIGPKTITIYDYKNRQIGKETVNFAGKDLFFSIQVDVAGKGMDKTFKARLVPLPDPRQTPGFVPGAMPGPGYPGMLPPGVNPGKPK